MQNLNFKKNIKVFYILGIILYSCIITKSFGLDNELDEITKQKIKQELKDEMREEVKQELKQELKSQIKQEIIKEKEIKQPKKQVKELTKQQVLAQEFKECQKNCQKEYISCKKDTTRVFEYRCTENLSCCKNQCSYIVESDEVKKQREIRETIEHVSNTAASVIRSIDF